mgnify:CR=1 FL=1
MHWHFKHDSILIVSTLYYMNTLDYISHYNYLFTYLHNYTIVTNRQSISYQHIYSEQLEISPSINKSNIYLFLMFFVTELHIKT